tara:strand:- start:300 stop:1064 length:765 start_codon:yes stop_codon:yes gene_type:complete
MALLLGAISGVQADSMKPTTLKILSFNILHGATTANTFDLDHIAKVIADVDPDLVALQEVDFKTRRARGYDLATELGQRTKMASVFAKAMDHDGGEYGEAILSRYSFESTRRIMLPYTEGHEPRAAVSATVRLPGGELLTFMGTHLDHESQADREAQATALNQEAAPITHPIILAGDFNATPESKTISILKNFWTVACGENPPPTFPSDDPKIKIDYVMFAPSERWSVVETQVLQDSVASDHCAYLVTLTLSAP